MYLTIPYCLAAWLNLLRIACNKLSNMLLKAQILFQNPFSKSLLNLESIYFFTLNLKILKVFNKYQYTYFKSFSN